MERVLAVAGRLGLELEVRPQPADPVRVTVEAVHPGGLAVVYRFGDDRILLVALNGNGDVERTWETLRTDWAAAVEGPGQRAAGTFRFVTGDAPAGDGMAEVRWGWLAGTLDEGIAVARPEFEDEAHRFLSGNWPVAWEIARRTEESAMQAEEARSRLDRAGMDRSVVSQSCEDLRISAANLGRLLSVDQEPANRLLLRPKLEAWREARRRWTAELTGSPTDEGSLPFPIASALRTWRRSWPPERRFRKALDAAEAIVAVPALLVAALLVAEGHPMADPGWDRPGYSWWPRLVPTLVKGRSGPQDPLLDPAAWRDVTEAHRPIVELRNKHHGHGPVREDQEFYEALCEKLEELVHDLLDGLASLGPMELGVLRWVERRRGCPARARIARAMGSNPHHLESWVELGSAEVWDGDVVLHRASGPISLHPFLRALDGDGLATIGCLSGLTPGGRAHWLCRATGSRLEEQLEPEWRVILDP